MLGGTFRMTGSSWPAARSWNQKRTEAPCGWVVDRGVGGRTRGWPGVGYEQLRRSGACSGDHALTVGTMESRRTCFEVEVTAPGAELEGQTQRPERRGVQLRERVQLSSNCGNTERFRENLRNHGPAGAAPRKGQPYG